MKTFFIAATLVLGLGLPTHSLTAAEFRAMTYNIWGRPWPLPSRPKRFPKIIKFLAGHGPDVIAFQESFSRKAKGIRKIPGYKFFARGPKGRLTQSNSGLVTVSKHPIIHVERMAYSDCAGTDCFARKGALMTTHMVPEIGLVDVVNTHLNAAGDDDIREAQLWELILFIKEKQTGGRPLIVMGDFNFTPDTRLFNQWTETANLVYDTHQKFVQDNPNLPDVIRQGWTKPRRNAGKPGKRIDYVFAGLDSDHLESVTSKIMFSDESNGTQLSDHLAVEVLFRTK